MTILITAAKETSSFEVSCAPLRETSVLKYFQRSVDRA